MVNIEVVHEMTNIDVLVAGTMQIDVSTTGTQGPAGLTGAPGAPGSPGADSTVAGPATPVDFTGTGFPEGVVTATVGKTYRDNSATNGAILWIKATGTGNTGWKVTYGKTPWRNVTSLLVADSHLNPVGAPIAFVSGTVQMRRVNDNVETRTINNLVCPATAPGTPGMVVPAGYGHGMSGRSPLWRWSRWDSVNTYYLLAEQKTGSGSYYRAGSGVANPFQANFQVITQEVWATEELWPATLPGVAI